MIARVVDIQDTVEAPIVFERGPIDADTVADAFGLVADTWPKPGDDVKLTYAQWATMRKCLLAIV